MSGVSLILPPEVLEQLAQRVADILEERTSAKSFPDVGSRWMTIEEASEYLRCRPQRVRNLRSARRLTPHVEGGRALCDRAEVENLVEEA
jgi:hypothetical protein